MGLIKNILYKTSKRSFVKMVSGQTLFPYYHIVNNEAVDHIKNLYHYKNVVQFENDIDFLLKNYQPLSPQLLLKENIRLKIPKNHFLLTFDDGLSEVYHTIFPILKKNKLNAIFFINPQFIGNKSSLYKHDLSVLMESVTQNQPKSGALKNLLETLSLEPSQESEILKSIKNIPYSRQDLIPKIAKILDVNLDERRELKKPYLTKDQIQEMVDYGFYFGGHTMTHPRLTELPIEQQTSEVLDSIRWLKDNFNIDYSMFAFPFSDKGISKNIIDTIFEYDSNAVIFGNSGIKKDIHERIIHRFSLENPSKDTARQITTENFYKIYNKIILKYQIKRKSY